ncbi:hypothetical protein MtrunA17_Chr6g0466171 [Medicago truncatula]|uniref:SNI1-like protein n=1 Tax=Medicago truncatula TaxID=3880 RepID=A0A396HCW4_MEDTR|nr:hypothetical protein MtrunA17_Chr6g0465481 [Medicago truncatula]RHN51227.1 hypothetical protein MtrunA17_Chr6g0466171 [Medicago truncatula]
MVNPNRASFEDKMLLTMFDACDAAKDATQDDIDDRLAFLDAVRASSIGLEGGKPPSLKICGVVFHMLRTVKSLQLIMACHKLLVDLEKHFPRAYLSDEDDSLSSSNAPPKLVVAEEAWSPLILGLDNAAVVSGASEKQSGGSLDPSLLQSLLLFQYLVIVLEGDFLPRNATMNWSLQRKSWLNMLLGSRKINYKSLMKNCIEVICLLCQPFENDNFHKSNTALFLALAEVLKNTRVSIDKFLVMILALDVSKKKADIEGNTSRSDGSRTPLVDIILDELAYNKDNIPHFFKPAARTRRSSGVTEDTTFDGALKCFSNKTRTKSIIKKIGADVVQLLLAHGFQAQLSILSNSALVDLCREFISTFESLRSTDGNMEILSIGKEALFTAACVISMKS